MKLISADALYVLGEYAAEEIADCVPESLPAACLFKALGVILLAVVGILGSLTTGIFRSFVTRIAFFNSNYKIDAEVIGFEGYRAVLIILFAIINLQSIIGIVGVNNLVCIAAIITVTERNGNNYGLGWNILN